LGGTAARIGRLLTTFLIGYVTDRFSFPPVVLAASVMPCVAMVLFVTMVRASKREDTDKLLLQF
jgi:predicted MFS family arabinose efflux permease